MARKLDDLIAALPQQERTAIEARATALIAEELSSRDHEPAMQATLRRLLQRMAASIGRRPVK
jgi:hypothetical protein